jgi:hypothetical protein
MDFYSQKKKVQDPDPQKWFSLFSGVFFVFFGFWAPFGPEVDPEGPPEIAFVGIRLEK